MTAVPTAQRPPATIIQSGIRPFDIGRDLRAVAELIAEAFRHELDDRGTAALREMRVMSHLGGFLRIINGATSELDDYFGGFVWVDHGKVVGNITVQRADKYGNRWQIANVAVAPSYRGRGLSRQLMEQALAHIRDQGGKWAVLQVYAQNVIARSLYDHLGFEEVDGQVEMEASKPPKVQPPATIADFHTFAAHNWQPLYELANNQLGARAQWWRAIRRSDFETPLEQQLGEWLSHQIGRQQVHRRCIQRSQRFEAAIIMTARRWRGAHKLQLWVRPENYGQLEQPLVQWGLAALQDAPVWPVQAQISASHSAAQEVLHSVGFRTVRTLLTMRLDVNPTR